MTRRLTGCADHTIALIKRHVARRTFRTDDRVPTLPRLDAREQQYRRKLDYANGHAMPVEMLTGVGLDLRPSIRHSDLPVTDQTAYASL